MTADYAPPDREQPGFCPMCGSTLTERDLPTETRPRLVCDGCGHILYLNPKIVAATIPLLDGKILLGRRAIEPRLGAWTFPSGFMELGETVEEAAIRETWEEMLAEVRITGLLSVYSRPVAGVVVVVFTADIVGGPIQPGEETQCIDFFGPNSVPWDGLAFDSTRSALRDWVDRWERSQAALRGGL